MTFLDGAQKNVRYSVLVDIGSGSVDGALVATNTQSNEFTILWSTHTEIARKNKIQGNKVRAELVSILDRTLDACSTKGVRALAKHDPRGRITHIRVGVAAPWTQTVSHTISIEHKKPFVLSAPVLDSIAKKAAQNVTAILAQDSGATEHISVLSSQVQTVRANGYAVAVPIGLEASAISTSISVTLIDSAMRARIQSSYERSFPHMTLTVVSKMQLLRDALRAMPSMPEHAYIIDVTTEATEIGKVTEGTLIASHSVPFGTSSISRQIADECNIPFESAQTFLRDSSKILNPAEKCKTTVQDVCVLYRTGIQELSERLCGTLSATHPYFLFSDRTTEAFFADQIRIAIKEMLGKNVKILPLSAHYATSPSVSDVVLGIHASAIVKQERV